MTRGIAHDPEIVRRWDEPFTEVELPDPVDDHPRHERVLRAGQPSCQPEPATGRGGGRHWRAGLLRGQHGGHPRLDDVARPRGVSALEDVGRGGLGAVLGPDVGVRWFLGLGRLDGRDPVIQDFKRPLTSSGAIWRISASSVCRRT